jgi:DNA-binding HxlR family transcriptional regulator
LLECEQGCSKRHPKECRRGEACKILKTNICAHDRDNLLKRNINENIQKHLEDTLTVIGNRFMQEVESLKEIFEKHNEDLKRENESKLNIIENIMMRLIHGKI